ncbi:MAG TPA: TIGR03089 family protein [Microlunatus sp.]
MTELFNRQLQARNRSAGSSPLITYYDDRSGERTELSGISFANWVDKTAGLLADELFIDGGQAIQLDLARTAPLHWVGLVWIAASWRIGCPVAVGDTADAAVTVVGPEAATDEPTGGGERVACSLHPLGLGFTAPLPAGVIDYGVEVRAQPDSYPGPYPDPAATAWIEDQHRLTQSELITSSPADGSTPARRTMISPDLSEPLWINVQRALVDPVITGGSVVIMIGGDADRRSQIAAAERADT